MLTPGETMPNTVEQLEFSHAKPVWDNLVEQYGGITPFCTFEWYEAWMSTFGTEYEPYILHINGTLAPFIKSGTSVFLYSKSTDYLDIIGDKRNLKGILSYLKQEGIQEVVIEKLHPNSETIAFFKEYLSENPSLGIIETANTTPTLTLPSTFEEYLATIKEKRRKYKKFMNENPTATVLTSTTPETDIDTLLSLMDLISFKKESSTPIRQAFFKKIARACKKFIWMQYVEVEGKTIASQILFPYKDEVMIYISGHEGDAYPNVGTFLIISAIKESIEKGFKKFNFLNGDRSYKYELGAVDVPLFKVTIQL